MARTEIPVMAAAFAGPPTMEIAYLMALMPDPVYELPVHLNHVLIVRSSGRSIEPMVQDDEEKALAEFSERLRQAIREASVPNLDPKRCSTWLAEKMKVTVKAANKWVNGESFPGTARFKKLGEVVGKSPWWLLFGEHPERVSATQQSTADDAETVAKDHFEASILLDYRRVGDDVQRRVRAMLASAPSPGTYEHEPVSAAATRAALEQSALLDAPGGGGSTDPGGAQTKPPDGKLKRETDVKEQTRKASERQ